MTRKRKPSGSAIRQDLLNQLERNGTTGEYYTDLVGDYMELWNTKTKLIRDLRERGVVIECQMANGCATKKKNESVELQIKVNAQMLKLLDALGVKPTASAVFDDEDM